MKKLEDNWVLKVVKYYENWIWGLKSK